MSNEGKNISIGTLAGKGTLVGSGQWILGENDNDFMLSTEIGITSDRADGYGGTITKNPSNLTKRGAGKMTIMTIGKLNAVVTVTDGTFAFNQASLADFINGTNAVTVKDAGRIVGQGKLQTLTVDEGGLLKPCGSFANETTPGTIKTTAMLTVKEGATVEFIFNKTKKSTLQPAMLNINGTVKVTLLNDYVPSVGDEFTLWTCATSFKGTPTFDLPTLPEGLYWDTREVAQKTGVLRVTDDASQGIGAIPTGEQVVCSVFTTSGLHVATFTCTKAEAVAQAAKQGLSHGAYIMRLQGKNRSEVRKVVVK